MLPFPFEILWNKIIGMIKEELKGYKNRKIEILLQEYSGKDLVVFYPGAKSLPTDPLFYWVRNILEINHISYIFFNFQWDILRKAKQDPAFDFLSVVSEEIHISFDYLKYFKHKAISIFSYSTGCVANSLVHDGVLGNAYTLKKIFWVEPHKSIKDVESLNHRKDYVYLCRNSDKFGSDFVFMLNKNTTLRETYSLWYLLNKKPQRNSYEKIYPVLKLFKSDFLLK